VPCLLSLTERLLVNLTASCVPEYSCDCKSNVQMIFSTATCCIIISDLPKACFLNGMKLLTPGSLYLLIADSALGVVWRLNHLTSKYEIALESPLMQPPTGPILLGINRIHVFDSFVYFTNSFQKLFARVPVYLHRPDAGSATGDYEIVANNEFSDDYTFDKEGNAYITQDPGNCPSRSDFHDSLSSSPALSI
jgi:hypothetical protein